MTKRYQELVNNARHAKKRAHTPYSHFPVGAALLAANGRIYTGCNVEVSSYGLTICAERTAIFKAVSEGERNFKAIAIVSNDPDITPPCGACRQVLWDLAGNIDIIMANPKGKTKTLKLKTLIPHAFDSRNLKRTLQRR
ncbi:MAG TPA: cytidine deaminase [Bacteroidota bacterium]